MMHEGSHVLFKGGHNVYVNVDSDISPFEYLAHSRYGLVVERENIQQFGEEH